jgi:release factor glutamine methyltransferase
MGATIAELLRTPGLAALDARVLLRAALSMSDAQLAAHSGRVPDAAQRARFLEWVERRRAGEPVAYLVGTREFYSLPFKVTPAVLIPRPETELLVEAALEQIPRDAPCGVLDLGTGSGCVAIAIAKERPLARVTATDVSSAALALARENAAAHRVSIELVESDWFAALERRRYELIVSNPPYVADGDPHLEEGDVRFEPRTALAAGANGLDAIEAIVERAGAHLAPGGMLWLEHGYRQGACARVLLAAHGFAQVATRRDLAGHERVSGGRFDGTPSQPIK